MVLCFVTQYVNSNNVISIQLIIIWFQNIYKFHFGKLVFIPKISWCTGDVLNKSDGTDDGYEGEYGDDFETENAAGDRYVSRI